MESPRGFNDATLGAFAEVARRTDLIILLGKAFDFTLKFGGPPIDPACRFVAIDPDGVWSLARRASWARLAFGCVADTLPAAEACCGSVPAKQWPASGWLTEAAQLMDDRPAAWADLKSKSQGKLHPAELFQALKRYRGKGSRYDPDLRRRRVRSMGSGHPEKRPADDQWSRRRHRVIVTDRRRVTGRGAEGTGLRHTWRRNIRLPYGGVRNGRALEPAVCRGRRNRSRWNAEYNLQVRDYGPNRTYGCELNPTRYDLVVAALGGHGELVETIADLPGAVERAMASGKPACINVMIESIPSPVMRR